MITIQGRQGAARRFEPNEAVDFVVVGSGPAGGSVARELTRLGHTVVLIEQGKFYTRADVKHDELGVILNNQFCNTAPTHIQTWRKTPKDKAEVRSYLTYATSVGGSSTHYAANYWRFRPGDFNEFSRKGNVSGAAMADWPITYRSEEHTSELQSPCNLVCRLLLEKKKHASTESRRASHPQLISELGRPKRQHRAKETLVLTPPPPDES